jgi:hypothetical protein
MDGTAMNRALFSLTACLTVKKNPTLCRMGCNKQLALALTVNIMGRYQVLRSWFPLY